MALPKKNTLNQVLFPLVDSTDFATIKSALSNAPTAKFYGVSHGGSAATTSGAVSKTISHVHSGLYRMINKAAECNYDKVLYRIIQASCADQIIVVDFVDNDDSDIMSALTVIQSMASDAASAAQQGNSRILVVQSQASDAYSAIIAPLASMTSDVASAVWAHTVGTRVDSRVLVNKSAISDAYSMLSDLFSDFQSRVPKRVATDSQLSDMASDVKSAVAVANSRLLINQSVASDLYSLLSDLQSDFQSRVPKRVATDSQLSDLASDIRSVLIVNQSVASDLYSLLSDLQSDFQSRVTKKVATDSALSDARSDIKSQIAALTLTISASDISDIASAVVAGFAGTLTASDISDIASAVWANTIGARVDSRVLVVKSQASDAWSMVSDLMSDFQSRVPKRVATDSQLSDMASDLKSRMGTITVTIGASDISDIASAVLAGFAGTLTTSDISDIASAVKAILASDLSDVLSAATQVNSRVLVAQSFLSDIRSHVSDLQSDFQSRVPKRVATDSQLSDLASDVKSAVAVANSRLVVAQSAASDIYSLLSDFQSDFSSRVPKLVATNSQLSDLASDVKSAVTVVQSMVSDVQSAVAVLPSSKLVALAAATQTFLLTAGSTTTALVFNATTGIDGGVPSNVDDFYNGRVVIFTSGALAGQATSISDYTGGSKTATVVALTGAPVSGVTGVIV